ncbi:hypothetical protein D9757_011337 [Collybiopsis confluens]|uniref:Uncharacterized protein n=1 Tax=Collybiopsis confluens TaxID=2823264 RepID=A0A8H5LP87_9AGAR|nr:hypothetical protein D9757_011337 [Collybiopsis confluens]
MVILTDFYLVLRLTSLQIIDEDSAHQTPTQAQSRSRLESDPYPLWDAVWTTFASRADGGIKSEVSVSVSSQYTLEYKFTNARKKSSYLSKKPDFLILNLDDTWSPRLIFWVEAKKLVFSDWFSEDGKKEAFDIVLQTLGQVNTQAQYAWAHFHLPDAAIIHAIINAAHTRSQDDDEAGEDNDDDDDDINTQPSFPCGRQAHCLFNITEKRLQENTFNLKEVEIEKVRINPEPFNALRIILNGHHGVRRIMQNVSWFDCNYASPPARLKARPRYEEVKFSDQ